MAKVTQPAAVGNPFVPLVEASPLGANNGDVILKATVLVSNTRDKIFHKNVLEHWSQCSCSEGVRSKIRALSIIRLGSLGPHQNTA
jgi:hypothetical protein